MAQGASGNGLGKRGGWLTRLPWWAWLIALLLAAVIGSGAAYFATTYGTRKAAQPGSPATTPPSASAPTSSSVSPSSSVVPTGTSPARAGTSTATSDSTSLHSGGASTAATHTTPPPAAVLSTLGQGDWQLYGARVRERGSPTRSGPGTDLGGIVVRCEAIAKAAGGGYAHGTFEADYTASGPVAGVGPWALNGEWVLVPDGVSATKNQYTGGIHGALSGRSSVRPPASGGTVLASMNPVGATRSKTGATEGGQFHGNAMFEGVLRLPSIPVPPASKF